MVTSPHFAAQYIRMSTDKQDLSPSVQKEAIAAYAAARGMEIVVSYEDEGRSGVHLKNRPGLLKLLHDITEPKRFSTVLVYDVSRWPAKFRRISVPTNGVRAQ
jgi:DNA invertase Pin-like site-specific DNA recombinase